MVVADLTGGKTVPGEGEQVVGTTAGQHTRHQQQHLQTGGHHQLTRAHGGQPVAPLDIWFAGKEGGMVQDSIPSARLENLTNDAIPKLYMTKFATISLYLTRLYLT